MWILLNPGPANTTTSVKQALVMDDLCHREPECFEMIRDCRRRLVALAGAGADFTAVLFAGSGTASVEAAIASALPPGKALLAVDNGVYGDRIARIAQAHGIVAHKVSSDIFTAADPAAVDRMLAEHPEISHVAIVHHETTTGLLNPVAEIARVAHARGRRVVVDAMSSLFGERLDVTQDGIDFVTASSNKCLQALPGISFVIARRSAVDALAGAAPRSVYLDLHNHYASQESDNTPFTPAVQVIHAMQQAIAELEAEGVKARIDRYAENARVLRAGMAKLGLEILVPEPSRSNILTTFKLPTGMSYEALHDRMKERGYIIYAGQGALKSYAFRVSNMGTLTPRDMDGVVAAFTEAIRAK